MSKGGRGRGKQLTTVNMTDYAAEHSLFIKGTGDSYDSKLKQFDMMFNIKQGERTAADLSDANQATYLSSVSETYNFHPSALKTASAALGKAALELKQPNIRLHPELFPEVKLAIQRWQTHLKQHPHYANKASRWSMEAVFGIGTMESETLQGNF